MRADDHEAISVKLEALMRMADVNGALVAYDRWTHTTKREDRSLLEGIARGVLRDIAVNGQETRVRLAALEELARAGEPDPISTLEAARQGDPRAYGSDAALARLGDQSAVARLEAAAQSPDIPDKSGIAEALGDAGSQESSPALVGLLKDSIPVTRAAAADALAEIGATAAIPELRAALADEAPEVKFAAAGALHRLGDSSGDEMLNAMLASEAPDIRLQAAGVLSDSPTTDWSAVVTPLLQNPDGLTRLHAAELIGRSDPDAARAVLVPAATQDQSAAVREEGSRIIAKLFKDDVALLRTLLRDRDPWPRLYAASALLPTLR